MYVIFFFSSPPIHVAFVFLNMSSRTSRYIKEDFVGCCWSNSVVRKDEAVSPRSHLVEGQQASEYLNLKYLILLLQVMTALKPTKRIIFIFVCSTLKMLDVLIYIID